MSRDEFPVAAAPTGCVAGLKMFAAGKVVDCASTIRSVALWLSGVRSAQHLG